MLAITNDVDLLKSLTTTLIDSVNGYRDAAANAQAGSLRDLFLESAVERQLAVEKLQRTIADLGGEVDDDPSLIGQAHQRWLDLRAALDGGDEDAILAEVERGESYLQQKFQESVDDSSVQGEARRAIEQAYESVCARYDQVRSLQRRREAPSDAA
jgi:uncharacterized protein (TIGR02284 family)